MQEVFDAARQTIVGMGTLAERLELAMREAGIKSAAELGRRVGVSRASAGDWLNGKTQTIDGDNLVRAAAVLGVHPRWLQTGMGPKSPPLRTDTQGPHTGYSVLRAIPLLSWEQATVAGEGVLPASLGRVTVAGAVGPLAFAIRQQGDSLEPRIPDGAIVVIDPGVQFVHGDIVLANRPDDPHAVLRQLWFDGGQAFLRPLNRSYPTLDMPTTTRVIGKAVAVQLTL